MERLETEQLAECGLNFWTGGYEVWRHGRSDERTRDDMRYDVEGCGAEESFGHEHIQKSIWFGYKQFTPQARKAFAGFILGVNSGAENLSYYMAESIKNNPRLVEVIKDNSKFFESKYTQEADMIIKAIEKQLRKPRGDFAFFVHNALSTGKKEAALLGFKYEYKYGSDTLSYNAPNNIKTQISRR
jgi:hypothetical protein